MKICLNLLFSNLSCQKYRHQSTTIIVAFGKVTPNGEALVMGTTGSVRARPGSIQFLGLGLKIWRRAQAWDRPGLDLLGLNPSLTTRCL